MTSSEETLILVLGVLVLIWLGMSMYVLITRFLHDLGAAVIRRAEIEVERRHEEGTVYGSLDLGPMIRRLPSRTIERVAADTATPESLATALSTSALDRKPAQLLTEANASDGRSPWKRVIALRILVRARSTEVPALLERALESDDETVVGVAVNALGELGDRPSSILLLGALREERFPRSRIAAQLDLAPGCSAELLIPLLRDPEPAVRFWGATLLGHLAADRSVAVELVMSTEDADPSVRAAAVEGLAGSDEPEACTAARRLVTDPVWYVRVHAVRTLRSFDRDDLLADAAPLLADGSWWVRTAAKETLESRPQAAAELLAGYLDHPDEFARNGAAEVLQNIGVVEELVSAAELDTAQERFLADILKAGGPRFEAMAAARSGVDAVGPDGLAEAS